MSLIRVRNFAQILVVVWSSMLIPSASTSCYFPDYLIGDYVTQTPGLMQTIPSRIQYSEISVTPDAITSWGFCHKKISEELYLIDNLSNSSYCMRCFHISMKSPNVLVIRTAGNPDRCFVSMPAVENSCPKTEYLENTRQIILYKTSKDTKKVNCPFNGRYMLQYKKLNPDGRSVECSSRSSEMSNCPIGSELKIRFLDCPFENHNVTFECLGSWNGPSNQQYLALYDTQAGNGNNPRPKYRCGLYLEDSVSGTVYIAFSSDSTCLANLKSSQSGFETLVLTPFPNTMTHVAKCRFPDWLEGEWDSAVITEHLFTYTDQILFTTFSYQCLNYDESGKRYDFPISANDDKKMMVYGKSKCGDEVYTCIWAKRRGINVFEFQLATQSSSHPNSTLCSPSNFLPDVWITQARQNYLANSPCPVEGEYLGTIPNAEGLCAKLSSDCSSLDTMFYTVSDCAQQTYEEKIRRYKRNTEQSVESSTTPSTSTEISPSTATQSVNISSTVPNSTEDSKSSPSNDSLEIETKEEPSRAMTTTSPSSSNVQSYFIENKNLSALLENDLALNNPARTFLPPPVAFSTSRPAVSNTADSYQFQNQPVQYNSYWSPHNQWDNQPSSNPYHQNMNHGRGEETKVTAGQIYFVDSQIFDKQRKTIGIPLPPVQVTIPSGYLGTVSRRRIDREYRCLGQWQENGFTYTFAERKNVGTYECFVGTRISDTEFSIREAGRHCERNHDSPSSLSMILTKKTSCSKNSSSPDIRLFPSNALPENVILPTYVPILTTTPPPPPSTSPPPPSTSETPTPTPVSTTTRYTQRRVTVTSQLTTTKPWKPITASPGNRPQSPYRTRKMGTQSNYGQILKVPVIFHWVMSVFAILSKISLC